MQPVAVAQVMPPLQRVATSYKSTRMSITSVQSVQMATASGFDFGGYAATPISVGPMPPPPMPQPVVLPQASSSAAYAAMGATVNAAEQEVLEAKFRKWPLMRQSLVQEQEAVGDGTVMGWQQSTGSAGGMTAVISIGVGKAASGGAAVGWQSSIGGAVTPLRSGTGFGEAFSAGPLAAEMALPGRSSLMSQSARVESRMPALPPDGEVITGPVKEVRIRASPAPQTNLVADNQTSLRAGPQALGLEGESAPESNDVEDDEFAYRKQAFENPAADYKYETYTVPRKVRWVERGRSQTGF